MSLSTEYWNDSFWTILYSIAYAYPNDPTEEFQSCADQVFNLFGQLLPDDAYRQHYCTFINRYPIESATPVRANLIKWVNDLHNFINKRYGREAVSLKEKINEMDNFDPDAVQKVVQNVQPIPRTNQLQSFSRHTGNVSYGVRRSVAAVDPVVNYASKSSQKKDVPKTRGLGPLPIDDPDLLSQDMRNQHTSPAATTSRESRRAANAVSYGMRKTVRQGPVGSNRAGFTNR